MAEATWRPIEGYRFYEVSDLGGVRSTPHTTRSTDGKLHTYGGRVLSMKPGKRGHLRVGLKQDGLLRWHLVHRLVYAAFVGPCEGFQVNHWPDPDPSINSVENLKLGDYSTNQFDSVAHGTHRSTRKTECRHGHPYDEANTRTVHSRDGRTWRECRACAKLTQRARYEKWRDKRRQ